MCGYRYVKIMNVSVESASRDMDNLRGPSLELRFKTLCSIESYFSYLYLTLRFKIQASPISTLSDYSNDGSSVEGSKVESRSETPCTVAELKSST